MDCNGPRRFGGGIVEKFMGFLLCCEVVLIPSSVASLRGRARPVQLGADTGHRTTPEKEAVLADSLQRILCSLRHLVNQPTPCA